VLDRGGDPVDRLVDLAQDRERVGTLDPRVVRDLVVGQERRVDHRAPGEHVGGDRRDLQVELDDGRVRAHQRVLPVALDPRTDVAADLLDRREALDEELPDHAQQRPGDAVWAGEVGEVVLPEPALAVAVEHGAHRQHAVRRVAGEDVRPAGAVGVEQAAPVGAAALDLGRVARMVGDDRTAGVLLPPAERGHVVVGAVQQARLAGTGLRGPIGLPFVQAVAAVVHPARQHGCVAVAQRAAQDVVGESVDLEAQEARHVGLLGQLRALGLAHDDVAVPEVAAVQREHAADQRRDQREAERDHDGLEQAVECHVVEQPRRPQQQRRVEDQRTEPERQDRERQREAHDQGPHDGVGDAEHGSEPERGQRPAQGESGQDLAECEQRQRVEQEHEREAAEQAYGHARGV
jgi:hypothetical protein